MKNKIIKSICIVILIYLCVSFVLMTFNPVDWGELRRGVFVVSSIFISGLNITYPKKIIHI